MTTTAKLIGIGIFALIVVAAAGTWLVKYHNDAVAEGIQRQKTIDLTVATNLVKERDELKKQDRTATRADICRRMHGMWDDSAGECN